MVGELLRCKNKLIMVTCLWRETVYLVFCSQHSLRRTPLGPVLSVCFREMSVLLRIKIYLFIYQLVWTQAQPTNKTQVPCEVPSLPNPTTRKGWPHHRGLRPLLFYRIVMWVFLRPTRTNQIGRDQL